MSDILESHDAVPPQAARQGTSETAAEREARLDALRQLRVLDTDGSPAFAEIVKIASVICRTPIALISLVDRNRQYFLSEHGLGVRETNLQNSVCATALHRDGVFVVPDLSVDPAYAGMDIVRGDLGLRFYAGHPIRLSSGVSVGMVCVLDRTPRLEGLSDEQAAVLASLARQVALHFDLRRREDELEQGRASLIKFFNRAPVGMLQTGLDGRIEYLNAEYAALLGCRPSEALRKPLADFVHPDDVDAHRGALELALANENGVTLETRYVAPDGRTVWSSDQVSASRDSLGRALSFSYVSRDITDRLKITSELAASERRFRAITDALPQMVWSTPPDGYTDYYNQRWYDFTGVPQGSTDGEAWASVFHPDDQERARERWAQCVATGDLYEIEYRLRHHSGEYRWVLGRGLPVRNAAGEIERWFGSCTDIEDIKRSEEARTLLAQELSHRIKNIFAVIGGLVTLTSRGDDAAKGFARAFRERLNALSLAHAYVRPDDSGTGQVGEALTVFGLMRTLVLPYLEDGRERFRFSGDDAEIGPKTATALALVMHEQATNAVKYGALSNEVGEVTVSGTHEGEGYTLIWREHGGPELSGTPTRRGFGTDMAARSAAGQLGGRIDHTWHPAGLIVTLTVPFENLIK